jgi:hypothetical protein
VPQADEVFVEVGVCVRVRISVVEGVGYLWSTAWKQQIISFPPAFHAVNRVFAHLIYIQLRNLLLE